MAWEGSLLGIYIAPEAGSSLVEVEQIRAVPGKGLEGDRYFKGAGSLSRWAGSHREVTLIAAEDLAAISSTLKYTIAAPQTRRNLLTRGVPLQQLIKKEFWVGEVKLKGVRLCQPCKYLARLLEEPDLISSMVHKGGLRASIENEGVIQRGDGIRSTRPKLR